VLSGISYDLFLQKYRLGDKQHKALRQQAKPDTFKPLYGGTKGTTKQEEYYKSFAKRYVQLSNEQDNWLADVQRGGSIRTAWGMVFSWDTYTKPNGMVMDKRTHKPVRPQVCNYPVQNLATAEIVPIAIVALYKRCKEEKLDVKFVNTIHDSVIVYILDCQLTLGAFTAAAEWAFTTAVYEHLELFYNIEFDVPLGMEMVIGDHWNEGTEHVYDDVERQNVKS
jgi:DNA polymerase I-like protein with 3'-5' exonuclease and polymerase domains